MKLKDRKYQNYVQILKEELVPAMGCTEPIAIAYCAAKATAVLNETVKAMEIEASGNIIKNVKSVIVPNTNGLKGIQAAAAAGVVAGKADKVLEVISEVSDEQKEEICQMLEEIPIAVRRAPSSLVLDLMVTVYGSYTSAKVRICNSHTNIVRIERNEEVLFEAGVEEHQTLQVTDRSQLNVEEICAFADMLDIEDVKETLDRQIAYNTAIAEEGLRHSYGANIGCVLLAECGNSIRNKAKAMAAAGSDARMSGCELPVIINSGSGNQGMAASLPVIVYAQEMNVSKDLLYRSLVVSNMATIHQKTGIGKLSAYCGAISAGCGAGAGICYLLGGDYKAVAHTLVNGLAILSGTVCDGAKASCAAKIAAAVDAGIFGYLMYKNKQEFRDGEGIISKGVENTIHNVCRLGKEGMKETDKEIINIMTNC